ncbi:TPA: DUF296 domain-containing protein, partial [Candidatus Micrarchaeota archaeon]|nr:DUF296 domain-containing protein [Candidatus Micrarchaeota archaeon]
GNFGTKGGETIVHAHVVVGKEGGEALGGHLAQATVHNTAEVVILELPGIIMERKPEPTGLVGLYPKEA